MCNVWQESYNIKVKHWHWFCKYKCSLKSTTTTTTTTIYFADTRTQNASIKVCILLYKCILNFVFNEIMQFSGKQGFKANESN